MKYILYRMPSKVWADKHNRENRHTSEQKVDGTDSDHFPTPIYLVSGEVDLNLLVARKKAG